MAVPPETAGAALDAAIEIFGRAGHTAHPGKSACWYFQKLQIQLALRDGGCGILAHDLKELQRLYVASALLVAPAVHAATGKRVGAGAPAEEGMAEIDPWG